MTRATSKAETLKMLRCAAHELRAPLSAVSMWTQVLAEDDGSARLRAVRALEESVRAQMRLIDELVDLWTTSLGVAPLRATAVTAKAIASDAMERATSACDPSRRTKIELACDDSIVVRVDRARLVRSLAGVLGRALDAAPTGGRVKMTIARQRGRARIAVTTPREPAHGGGSIAVSLGRAVATLHGGSLVVERTARGACTYVIDLPATSGTSRRSRVQPRTRNRATTGA